MKWRYRAGGKRRVLTQHAIGAGESGKSTVLKQMRLIHTKGFQTAERKQWKVTIFNNLLHAFQVIFGAMEEQEVDFAEEGNIVSDWIQARHEGWNRLTFKSASRRSLLLIQKSLLTNQCH